MKYDHDQYHKMDVNQYHQNFGYDCGCNFGFWWLSIIVMNHQGMLIFVLSMMVAI
jgi:hypothetical protein